MNARREVKKSLESNDFELIKTCFKSDAALTMRTLQMYVYGMPNDILRWRAITFIGKLSGLYAAENDELFRNIIRRFIWQMCEESANVPWASAEIIGSILANVDGSRFREFIGPWFYHVDLNDICYAGLYYILPQVMKYHSVQVEEFLSQTLKWFSQYDMPDLRAYAALYYIEFPKREMKNFLSEWLQDHRKVLVYYKEEFKECIISELAKQALNKICS